MKDTLLTINKPLPDLQRRIFQEVFEHASKLGLEPLVVGAAARDLVFEYVYDESIERKTEDLDFAIAVSSWEEYETLRNELIKSDVFRADRLAVHRLWLKSAAEEMKVDLVPFGGLEQPAGSITFPPDNDFVMSTIGFPEAAQNSILIDAGHDLIIRTVSLAGLAMLKFGAFSDRPQTRQRDVQDIGFIASNYTNVGNEERLYDRDIDILNEDGFDLRFCGARLLGRDIGAIVTPEIESTIGQWIGEGTDNIKYEQFTAVLTQRKSNFEETRHAVDKLFAELWKGIEER